MRMILVEGEVGPSTILFNALEEASMYNIKDIVFDGVLIFFICRFFSYAINEESNYEFLVRTFTGLLFIAISVWFFHQLLGIS